MSDELKEKMREAAVEGMSRASREGSYIEHVLSVSLQAAGYQVIHHHETLLGNESMHLDLWLPQFQLAIEIDGPTHFIPIWGEERLVKTQAADNEKTGLILSYGYRLLRVKYMLKSLSKYRERLVIRDVRNVIKSVEEGNTQNYFEIEVSTNGCDNDNGDEGNSGNSGNGGKVDRGIKRKQADKRER